MSKETENKTAMIKASKNLIESRENHKVVFEKATSEIYSSITSLLKGMGYESVEVQNFPNWTRSSFDDIRFQVKINLDEITKGSF